MAQNTKDDNTVRCYSDEQVAALLSCSLRTVKNLRAAGTLPSCKVRKRVFVRHTDLADMLARHRIKVPGVTNDAK